MPKEEWGVKRTCPKCSTRFYDLQRDPMTCPSCGEVFSLDSLLNPGGRTSRTEKASAEPVADIAKPSTDDDDVDVLDDGDDDTDVDLGDDVLDEDEDETVDLEEITDVAAEDDDN